MNIFECVCLCVGVCVCVSESVWECVYGCLYLPVGSIIDSKIIESDAKFSWWHHKRSFLLIIAMCKTFLK